LYQPEAGDGHLLTFHWLNTPSPGHRGVTYFIIQWQSLDLLLANGTVFEKTSPHVQQPDQICQAEDLVGRCGYIKQGQCASTGAQFLVQDDERSQPFGGRPPKAAQVQMNDAIWE
jgi:hypothetical protein